jgi:cytoskeletal protein RodZ
MARSTGLVRGFLGLGVLAVLIVIVALPAFAADPSASPDGSTSPAATAEPTPTPELTAAPTPEPTAAPTPTPAPVATPVPAATAAPAGTAEPVETAEPDESGKPDKGDKPDKQDKTPEVDVTVTGTVGTKTDANGNTEYTLTAGAKVLVLDAGPPWFYGDNHPLKAYVGKKVTITGSQHTGSNEVEVAAVDGKVIRAAGKPPWAGGWKAVGARHPGWSQEKWDRWQAKSGAKAKAFGVDCFPPGQCKAKTGSGAAPGDKVGADAGG